MINNLIVSFSQLRFGGQFARELRLQSDSLPGGQQCPPVPEDEKPKN